MSQFDRIGLKRLPIQIAAQAFARAHQFNNMLFASKFDGEFHDLCARLSRSSGALSLGFAIQLLPPSFEFPARVQRCGDISRHLAGRAVLRQAPERSGENCGILNSL
jgi:hypothetical protein